MKPLKFDNDACHALLKRYVETEDYTAEEFTHADLVKALVERIEYLERGIDRAVDMFNAESSEDLPDPIDEGMFVVQQLSEDTEKKRKYRYARMDGSVLETDSPMFYFEWTYGKGAARFGMHGTDEEYYADSKRDMRTEYRRVLHVKRPMEEINNEQ